jgi:hypothetical protein
MLLFRSEGHVSRWCAANQIRGESFTLGQGWKLARAWYADRLESTWRRKTVEEAEAVFTSIGLTSSFWRLR